MNLVTVYKALRKQAAGVTPGQPEGSGFKPLDLPPITAQGSTPIMNNAPGGASDAAPTSVPQQGMDAKMLEKGWEKTMDAMQNITAMNNGMPPQTGAAAPAQQLVGAGIPGMSPTGMPVPGQKINTASAHYGTIYKAMSKRASWLGRQINDIFGADTFIGRTFGESNDTAIRNFFDSHTTPEQKAQLKADAAAWDKQVAAANTRLDKGLAEARKRLAQGKGITQQPGWQESRNAVAETQPNTSRSTTPKQQTRRPARG